MKKYRDRRWINSFWYRSTRDRSILQIFFLVVEWRRSRRRMRTTTVICFEGRQVNIVSTEWPSESPPFSDGKKYGRHESGSHFLSLSFFLSLICRRSADLYVPRVFTHFFAPFHLLGNLYAPPVATELINHWLVLNDHEPCKTTIFSTRHTRTGNSGLSRLTPPCFSERNMAHVIFAIIFRLDVKKDCKCQKDKIFKLLQALFFYFAIAWEKTLWKDVFVDHK